ncbi:unnamed protein product [Caenorhabditis angaria]|uniref:Uncharacterized protein n=1 Tax=Caenorhabditis angaria TaxID=860376 RepID=A0A9P1IMG9_9PELO|nr:unnamed protein product [Caenorhabditis angaria]
MENKKSSRAPINCPDCSFQQACRKSEVSHQWQICVSTYFFLVYKIFSIFATFGLLYLNYSPFNNHIFNFIFLKCR